MYGLIITLLIMLTVLALVSGILWGTHISMVKDEHCPYGWASFRKFKREFDKYKWEWDSSWSNSLFNYSQGGYLHASIYKFDNKGMIMTDPISFLLSVLYIKKYIRKQIKPYQKEIIKW